MSSCRRWSAYAAALAVTVAAGAASPALAAGPAGRSFTLAGRQDGVVEPSSMVATPDGGLIFSERSPGGASILQPDNVASVEQLTPSGRITPLLTQQTVDRAGLGTSSGFVPAGLGRRSDGTLLIADYIAGRVLERAPGGRLTVLLGGLPWVDAVAATPDGGVVVADFYGIWRVSPQGQRVRLATLTAGALAVTADGSVIASVPEVGVVLISPDGSRRTVYSSQEPQGVALLADGSIVAADVDRVVCIQGSRVTTLVGAHPFEQYGEAGPLYDQDVPGPRTIGDGLPARQGLLAAAQPVAVLADGGLAIGEVLGIRYIAPATPRLLAVAAPFSRIRAGRRRTVVPLQVTRPARVHWRLEGDSPKSGRLVDRHDASRIVVRGALRPGLYDISLVGRAGGRRADDDQLAFLGGHLPIGWADRAAGFLYPAEVDNEESDDEAFSMRRVRCVRATARRVNCRWTEDVQWIDESGRGTRYDRGVVSVTLRRDGQLLASMTSHRHGTQEPVALDLHVLAAGGSPV
jgi:hypothetical protein